MHTINDFELTKGQIETILRQWSVPEDIIESYGIAKERAIAKAAQRKLVEKLERMFNRLISAQSRKDLLESPEWQELRKGVGLE